MADQWVVAVMPSSSPAAASTSDPVHTDVVNVVVRWALRTQSSTRSSSDELAGADAAGEHDDVGRRHLVVRGVDLDAEEAVVGTNDLTAVADERDDVAGDPLEHLVRADAVEGGEAVEDGDGDRLGLGLVHEAWSFRWWLKRRR